MSRAGEAGKRPLAGAVAPWVCSVEVARGRAGYGFTLAGQAPCVLSCVVRGSPADCVGLRPGDQILSVNETSVRRASHEDVVQLIGRCSGVLRMVVGRGAGCADSGSSDEEAGLCEGRSWWKPRLDSKALGINRAERVVEEVQSGGIFSMMFESPVPPRPRAPPEGPCAPALGQDEVPRAALDDAVFSVGLDGLDDAGLDASILNVAVVVGYLGSIELPSTSSNLEGDSLQAIRGCMRRLRAEQKIHSLVSMKILHDRVQLCSDRAGVVAEYPAEKLAFSAVCPDDRRFFGLVTMQAGEGAGLAPEEEGALRTSCHVFMVDPDLFPHRVHQGVARRFGFACTADPDTSGCLEFPASSLPVLQFVSVLYRDMGELIEGVRARAFLDGDADAQHHHSTSSNSDSGIGNFTQEEKSNRVLVVDLGGGPSRHGPGGGSAAWEAASGRPSQSWGGPWNGAFGHDTEGGASFDAVPPADRSRDLGKHLGPACPGEGLPVAPRSSVPPTRRGGGQRWLPVHVLQEWQCGHASDQESYTDSTDGWSSINCGTLPPPMSKIPADRYRVEGSCSQPPLGAQKADWSRKAFGMQSLFSPHRHARKSKESKKGSKCGHGVGLAQTSQRPSARRSLGRSKRFSATRSLDDLESATVSDGELTSADLKDCVSNTSLPSNGSLPSVQSCRRLRERRVASWAVSFERLLQDPLGVRYFSDFLRKEFSEENILFWQACEGFSHVPAHDQRELSSRAQEIFSRFLGSKAATPVNIDSQAQLAADILSAPHPDMFKEQQLQIFNLMKFDSYTRFLKSQLYQECVLAEVEGRGLPDAQQVPGSPVSKHSVSSDHSNMSTPKKLSGKSKSGRSLNEELGAEDSERRRRAAFFSWSKNRSAARSQKKRDPNAPHTNGGLHRRESQGSVSSAGSLDLPEACRTLAPERDKAAKQCCVQLPDGSSCMLAVRSGFSIKEVLAGLCEQHGINGAAVDLFLVGGDKPLVLHQDSSVLESRNLRLEKRTLFRLDLVPINRSVGLKAKPTKPVTEVLRPVVAKYGLDLGGLLVRLSGEKEPLDLGAPISSLDGQRVILEERGPPRGREKHRGAVSKPSLALTASSRSHSATGEERALGKSNSIKVKGDNGKNAREPRLSKREESIAKIGKKKNQKINLDEAEEFFELISKAQSNRAEDQRGLLRREDLVLPEFLRLPLPCPAKAKAADRRGAAGGAEEASPPSEESASSGSPASSSGSAPSPAGPPAPPAPPAHLWRRPPREAGAAAIQTVEDEQVAELTLLGEGDISSPNSTVLPPPPSPPDAPGAAQPGGGAQGTATGDLAAGAAPGPGNSVPQSPSPGVPAQPQASAYHATFV